MARLAIGRPAAIGVAKAMERPRAATGWLERAAPWLVFGLAAAFRLASLDLAAFGYDEADLMLRSRAVAFGQLPLVGTMTSWGFPDPPLQIYLLAAVARSPWPAMATLAVMALLNALAVLGTYWIGARFFGWRVGLLAGLLFALNPWAIYFGRRGWVQLQPALTVLALWAAFEVVVARRAFGGLPFFLALAANVQARLLAACYAPAMLASLALGGRRWLSRWSVFGVLGGILLSLPYAIYLFTGREQITAILAEGNRGVAEAPAHGVLEFSWWLVAGLNLLPTPAGLTPWLDQLGATMQLQAWLVAALLLAGLAMSIVRIARRATDWRCYALLLVWTVLPLGLVALQSSTIYLHYLVLLYPLPFLLMALPLDALAGLRTPLRWLAPLLCLAVVLPQAGAWIALQRTLLLYDTNEAAEAPVAERRMLAALAREADQRLATGEQYGIEVPVRYWLAAADRARAELAARPRELLVLTAGTEPLAEEKPAIFEAVLGPDPRPRYLTAEAMLLPIGRPALLLVTSDVEPIVTPERIGQRIGLVPLPTEVTRNTRDGIRFLDLPARSPSQWARAIEATPPKLSQSVRGVFFQAQSHRGAGETLEVLTLWSGPLDDLRPRVALLGPEGRIEEDEAARRLALNVPADQLLVMRHQLEIPSRAPLGEYRLVAQTGDAEGWPIELRRVVIQDD